MRQKNFFYSVFAVVLSFAISGAAQAQAGNQPFLRGDSNADARIDLSDAIFSLRYLFQGGDAPPCLDALDSNDSGIIDISDPAHILRHLFQGAAAPPAPGM
ncbi:MAG: hypothetical protein VX496_07845, partial [Planctomycetota bacterium]|nr:hypothetical protein [Planctomycetota bacterium]